MLGVTAHLHHCTGTPELPDEAARLPVFRRAMA
ncbi:hypothetical protein MicloDRAFT_00041740 [Microvirga lotononidis]|uniref:Uncharacterized protein n=1 Tax=Microvirga lotononidis TaxID=864069 RepID=I4YUG2_9HYPH|nr:hypothetical protein MicloDRAFT_00041740 [Microvirga lotononidis]